MDERPAQLNFAQRRLWRELRFERPRPDGDRTPEQTRNLHIASFQNACAAAGLAIPSDAAVAEEIDRSSGDRPIPPEEWIIEKPFDSAEWLKRRPVYEDEL